MLANGAAAFAGGNGVSTNQSFGIDQYGRVSIREDASGLTDVFAILKGSSTTKTCTISNDGTVTAGLFSATGVNNTGVEAGSGGLLSVQRGPSSGTSDVFRGYQGATVNARIHADGAAEFGGNILPKTDAGFSGHSDLGSSSKRYEDAFVRDGVTTGSDRNYKSDIRELLDAERSVAVACKSLLRAWKWTSAVSEKGDAARIHIGIIAQDLEQAFTDQGLDAHNYAMFCEDTWYEVDGQSEDSDGNKYTVDSEGAVAVTRLSVRYHELLAFIIAAI